MSVSLFTRFGRGRSIGMRIGLPGFFLFYLPLWIAEVLSLFMLRSLKGAVVSSTRVWGAYRQSHQSPATRRAIALALTRESAGLDAEAALRQGITVWAVYGLGSSFFHGRFPAERERLRALYPGHSEQIATLGRYPTAESARRVANGLRRHGFTVAELLALFVPQARLPALPLAQPEVEAPSARDAAVPRDDGAATSDETVQEAAMNDFVVGHQYPMAAIQSAFGGDNMSYLPEKGGRIVCGRFTTEMNPEAPEMVLVGDRPQVKRKAELLAQQGGTLPVFMKLGPNRWRYEGLMHVVGYVTDMGVVAPKAAAAGRMGEVAGMLVLRRGGSVAERSRQGS